MNFSPKDILKVRDYRSWKKQTTFEYGLTINLSVNKMGSKHNRKWFLRLYRCEWIFAKCVFRNIIVGGPTIWCRTYKIWTTQCVYKGPSRFVRREIMRKPKLRIRLKVFKRNAVASDHWDRPRQCSKEFEACAQTKTETV